MRALGLDIGTSSIKAAVLDVAGQRISHIRSSPFCNAILNLPPLHVEIEPLEVVERVRGILRELLTEGGEDCEALFCCTQMQGVVLVDEKRSPVTNYISWRDERVTRGTGPGSAPHQDWVRDRLGVEGLRRLGNEFRPGYPLNLISWLARNQQLPAGELTALGLGDFVLMTLSGGSKPMAHRTTAAGALDLTTGDWLQDALPLLGVSNVHWPRLAGADQPVGEWRSKEAGRAIRCFPAIGDHPCALAGIGLQPRELSVNVSTGSQVSTLTLEPQVGEGYQTRRFIDGRFLNTITHLPAGRALNVLVGLLSEAAPGTDLWPRIERGIEATPETDLDVNLAFFSGPAGNDGGHIANIGIHNLSLGHLFRAAINNMADNYTNATRKLGQTSEWDRIVFSGGLAQKIKALRTAVTQRIGLPARTSAETEETLRGLLTVAKKVLQAK